MFSAQETNNRIGWHSLRLQREYDEERTKYLEAGGYRVLRFWNNDVMNNMENVLQVIWNALQDEEKKE